MTYLVGHSRGGTTWLGELLSLHNSVRYIFEPFASQVHPYTGIDMQSLFNNHRRIQYLKKGRTTTEYPSSDFFNMDPDKPCLEPYRYLAKLHLDSLIDSYLGYEHNCHVVIKQPRLENLGWAVSSIGADLTVFIDRHPFGIVNSYYRGNFWHWMEPEWRLAKESIPRTHPEYRHLFEEVNDPFTKELVLTYVRSQEARRFCNQNTNTCVMLSYERLCDNPVEAVRNIIERIGLRWDEETERRLLGRLVERDEKDAHFLSTKKDPKRRMLAWRVELPVGVIEKLTEFAKSRRMTIALPGVELTPIGREEARASASFARILWRKRIRRRFAFLLEQGYKVLRTTPAQRD